MAAIVVNSLQKRFGKNNVLNGIDLEVPQGSIYAILGRNGAGKSTFINVLTGSMSKSGGDFKLLGTASDDLDHVKARIGVMPDASEMYGNMQGGRFLKYMGSLKGVSLSDGDVETLMNRVRLNCPANRKLKDYSFGMRKKIGVAQSLIGNPELLFLDEPTSGVDPESALHLRDLFKTLNTAGTTIFMASHNMEEVRTCCTHMCILDKGVLPVWGSIDEVIAKHTGVFKIKVGNAMPQGYDIRTRFPDLTFDSVFSGAFTVELPGRASTPGFISKLVADGVSIYTVEEVTVSLEEIFLQGE